MFDPPNLPALDPVNRSSTGGVPLMPTQPDEAGNTRKGLSQEAPIVVGQIVSDLHKDLLFDGQVRLVLAPNHKHHLVALLSAFLDELDDLGGGSPCHIPRTDIRQIHRPRLVCDPLRPPSSGEKLGCHEGHVG